MVYVHPSVSTSVTSRCTYTWSGRGQTSLSVDRGVRTAEPPGDETRRRRSWQQCAKLLRPGVYVHCDVATSISRTSTHAEKAMSTLTRCTYTWEKKRLLERGASAAVVYVHYDSAPGVHTLQISNRPAKTLTWHLIRHRQRRQNRLPRGVCTPHGVYVHPRHTY